MPFGFGDQYLLGKWPELLVVVCRRVGPTYADFSQDVTQLRQPQSNIHLSENKIYLHLFAQKEFSRAVTSLWISNTASLRVSQIISKKLYVLVYDYSPKPDSYTNRTSLATSKSSLESMEAYKYKPLRRDRDELRLIKLLPTPPNHKVVIEIFHTDAASSPDYEALSYVWGAPYLTHEVCVREKRSEDLSLKGRLFKRLSYKKTGSILQVLPITRNLAIALSYLTLPDRPRIFWIDAICINQADDIEKGIEVGKMGEIYGQARRVVVWIGEGREDSWLAITTLETVGQGMQSNDDGSFRVKYGSEVHYLDWEIRDPQNAKDKEYIWTAIRSFFNVEWFTRLWVFQEIGRASDAIFVVGTDCIRWHILVGAFRWIANQSRRATSSSQIILDEKIIQKARPVFDHFSELKVVGYTPLISLTNWTKRLRCYEPRDRIYALLSLTVRKEAAKMVPDYRSTVEQVYTNAVLNNIQFARDLRILEVCDSTKADSNLILPSWVPDFSIPNLELGANWRAAGLSVFEYRHDEVQGTLHLRGRNVCTINYVATPIPISASLAEILAICHAWEPVHASDIGYITGGSLMDAYIATLFFCRCPQDIYFMNNLDLLSVPSMNAAYLSLVAEGVVSVDHQPYADYLRLFLPGRTFFTTKEGYIGLCPASVRLGDQICVALGSYSPLVLRPVPGQEGYYQVGCTCFTNGLMMGEGILGPLPPSWTHSWGKVGRLSQPVFLNPNGVPTQFDPRAGPLPPGWKVRYYGPQPHRKEIDREGNLREQWFEDEEIGEKTWRDPRLTSENLEKMGIELQDIILV